MNILKTDPIDDVQNTPDLRNMAIDKVGIKSLRYPICISDRSEVQQYTVAIFDMFVFLPQHFKGTHMSRFIEILNDYEPAISVESFESILRKMCKYLEAESGYLETRFPYFRTKHAPVSKVQSKMDYDVTLMGEINKDDFQMHLKVLVPVTSLCPCSKKISEHGAHNQRSHITVTATLNEHVWIEEIIELIEKEASCELYGLLKRPDEKYVTEHAYNNPKFVEDMVRDVAAQLNKNPRIAGYTVESENFESIHNHSAYALIEKKPNYTKM